MSDVAITFDDDYSIDFLWLFNWFHKLCGKSKSKHNSRVSCRSSLAIGVFSCFYRFQILIGCNIESKLKNRLSFSLYIFNLTIWSVQKLQIENSQMQFHKMYFFYSVNCISKIAMILTIATNTNNYLDITPKIQFIILLSNLVIITLQTFSMSTEMHQTKRNFAQTIKSE